MEARPSEAILDGFWMVSPRGCEGQSSLQGGQLVVPAAGASGLPRDAPGERLSTARGARTLAGGAHLDLCRDAGASGMEGKLGGERHPPPSPPREPGCGKSPHPGKRGWGRGATFNTEFHSAFQSPLSRFLQTEELGLLHQLHLRVSHPGSKRPAPTRRINPVGRHNRDAAS